MWNTLKRQNIQHIHLLRMQDAWQNIVYRINKHPNVTPLWKQKFAGDNFDYLMGVKLENKYNHHLMSLDCIKDYESFRRYSSGVKPNLSWIELFNMNHYGSQSSFDGNFELTAAIIVGIDNDLLSRTDETCNILQVMSKSKCIQYRNYLMHQIKMMADTSHSVYHKQIVSFIEGIIHWQLRAKQRYLENSIITKKYYDENDDASFYYPNTMNICMDCNVYSKLYNSILSTITIKSYDFADSHQLLLNDNIAKIWQALNVGFFALSYPFIKPESTENVELLQLICDFVGWQFLLDDLLEFTDDSTPYIMSALCFEELLNT